MPLVWKGTVIGMVKNDKEWELRAYCGADCGACGWKDKVGCKGCRANAGDMFWGECDKAKCCIKNEFAHCGACEKMPCESLLALINDPEHGDSGERIANLKSWTE